MFVAGEMARLFKPSILQRLTRTQKGGFACDGYGPDK